MRSKRVQRYTKGKAMDLPIKTILTVTALSLLVGCASNLKVTFDSDPPGAALYQGQQRFGYTPFILQYTVSKEDKERGYKVLAGTSVRWASGATAEENSLTADLKRYGYSQQFTFQRPENVPGRETDERFSLELNRTRAIERQASAQEEQAAAQQRQAAAQEARARAEQYKIDFPTNISSPTNCTSTVFGNTVNTSCY